LILWYWLPFLCHSVVQLLSSSQNLTGTFLWLGSAQTFSGSAWTFSGSVFVALASAYRSICSLYNCSDWQHSMKLVTTLQFLKQLPNLNGTKQVIIQLNTNIRATVHQLMLLGEQIPERQYSVMAFYDVCTSIETQHCTPTIRLHPRTLKYICKHLHK